MKNALLFTYRTNILVSLPTVNMRNFLTPKNPKMCDPFPAAPPHKEVPPPGGGLWMDERALSFLGIVYGVNNALTGLAVWLRKRRTTRFCPKKIYFNYRPVKVFQSMTLKYSMHCVSSLLRKCPYIDLYGNSSRG